MPTIRRIAHRGPDRLGRPLRAALGAGAITAAVALTITGCSAFDPTSGRPPVVATATPAADVDRDGPFRVDVEVGEVVATGTLASRAVPELEGVEVTVTRAAGPGASSDGGEATASPTATPTPAATASGSATATTGPEDPEDGPLDDGPLLWHVAIGELPTDQAFGFGAAGDLTLDSRCAEESARTYAFGDLGVGNDPAGDVFEADDPTWISSVVLWILPPDITNDASNCLRPLAAIAMLEWEIDPAHPTVEAVDGGAIEGATGDPVIGEEGGLLQYLTAADDTLAGVAERFGLTEAELVYLNPVNDRVEQGDPLSALCSINLALDARAYVGECVAA